MSNEKQAKTSMTIGDALKILGIEDYGERIFNSNSHGELFHLLQYAQLARVLKDELEENPHWFRDWFVQVISYAEKELPHPEYIFQHILDIFLASAKARGDLK